MDPSGVMATPSTLSALIVPTMLPAVTFTSTTSEPVSAAM